MSQSSILRVPVATTFACLFLALLSCKTESSPTDLTRSTVIPRPVFVEATAEAFVINEKTSIIVSDSSEGMFTVAGYLAGKIIPATGFHPEIRVSGKTPGKGSIHLIRVPEGQIVNPEGYEMEITKKGIRLSAAQPAGLFYGVQTLLQLLPAAIERNTLQQAEWSVPTGIIRDAPEYAYRGAMLDVARHFFKPEDVRRFIDLMASYKFNHLHLHLSDDQGWRIEIKSWPNLTAHGGLTQVGGGPGGFYTQEEYSAIVQYAQSRFITIVPEIDMPGHTNAALASYAELNCIGKATELYTGTNVGFSTLCTSKEITYQFIADVFRELSALTPGPYIHMGGDESHVTKKEDYIPFIARVQDIVVSMGKAPMGWDDIAASTLKSGTVCQHWATVENALSAVGQGSKLVFSPARKAYLDMKYDSTTTLGLKWAGYIEVDSAYAWDPATLIPGLGKDQILGIEAPLWTETVSQMDEVEFLVFPRLPGYAEIGWTPAALRSWDEYRLRLQAHGERFEAQGIHYYRSGKVW